MSRSPKGDLWLRIVIAAVVMIPGYVFALNVRKIPPHIAGPILHALKGALVVILLLVVLGIIRRHLARKSNPENLDSK